MLSIQPKIRLTITYGMCISLVVELELGGGSANNGATPSSFIVTSYVYVWMQMINRC